MLVRRCCGGQRMEVCCHREAERSETSGHGDVYCRRARPLPQRKVLVHCVSRESDDADSPRCKSPGPDMTGRHGERDADEGVHEPHENRSPDPRSPSRQPGLRHLFLDGLEMTVVGLQPSADRSVGFEGRAQQPAPFRRTYADSHSSNRFPSGSRAHPNRPYSYSSTRSSTSIPAARSWDSMASRSRTL